MGIRAFLASADVQAKGLRRGADRLGEVSVGGPSPRGQVVQDAVEVTPVSLTLSLPAELSRDCGQAASVLGAPPARPRQRPDDAGRLFDDLGSEGRRLADVTRVSPTQRCLGVPGPFRLAS